MREDRGWTQQQLAAETGMAQPRISVLEDASYEKFNIKTLRRIASAFDVALIVKFLPFSELVDWVTTISPERLAPPSFENDTLRDIGSDQSRVPAGMDARLIPVIGQEATDLQIAAAQSHIVAIPFPMIQDKRIEPSAALSMTGLHEMDDLSSSRSGVLPTRGAPIVGSEEINAIMDNSVDLSRAQSAMVIELATFRHPRQNHKESAEGIEIQRELVSVMVDIKYA
jgi:transcriptional regulator with XRE-family HTH domain